MKMNLQYGPRITINARPSEVRAMLRNLAVLSIYSTFEACNRSYGIRFIRASRSWKRGSSQRAQGDSGH